MDKEVSGLSDDELAVIRNKTIGFVFQNFNFLPKLTSLENVALPAVYAGMGKKKRLELVIDALKKVSLDDRAGHLPNERFHMPRIFIICADNKFCNAFAEKFRRIIFNRTSCIHYAVNYPIPKLHIASSK